MRPRDVAELTDDVRLHQLFLEEVDTVRPEVATELREPVELLLVTVKAPALEDALGRIQGPAETIVPLLNGIEHMQAIRSRFPRSRVLGATIGFIEAWLERPGVVVLGAALLAAALLGEVWCGAATHCRDAILLTLELSNLNLTIGRDPKRTGHIRIFEAWANVEHTLVWVYEETPPRVVHRVIVYDADTGEKVHDFSQADERVVVARGGRGGSSGHPSTA